MPRRGGARGRLRPYQRGPASRRRSRSPPAQDPAQRSPPSGSFIEAGRRTEAVLGDERTVRSLEGRGHVALNMSGNSGDDARLDSVHPSPDGAVVGPTGAGEMVCPQAAHRASIAGGPVFQRPVIKIVEDLYEVQHERRMVKARGFSDLVERYELVELGEPIFVVDDGRNKAPTRRGSS